MKSKKNTMKSLALAGLMTSLNIIIILLSSFQFSYIFSDLLLTLFFPLITTITFLLCDKRTSLCYFIASFAICFVIQFQKTIFYLLPSMISGFLFALFIQKKWNYIYAIITVSLINAMTTALLFVIGERFFSLPIYQAFQTIFRLDEQQAKEFFPLFIAITSIAQTIINALIIYYELPKYEMMVVMDNKPILYLFYFSVLFSVLSGVLMYFNASTAMFFFGISLPSVPFSIYFIIKKKRWWILIVSALILIFGFAIFSTVLPNYGFLGISYWILMMNLLGIFHFQKADSFLKKE